MEEKLKGAVEIPAFRVLLIGDFSKHPRIPSAFIKNFGGRSLRKCTLRNPSGDCWAVKLKQKEDGLFFRKGWKVFVKDYLLEHGNFLVLGYGGGSEFDVTIFDRTCCEKRVEEAATRTIPKDVAIAEGLVTVKGLPSRETVMLQDPTGRSWLAQLHVRADHRVQIARGCVGCVRAHKISPGDDILFEFVKRGVTQLHIFRGNVLLTAPDVSN